MEFANTKQLDLVNNRPVKRVNSSILYLKKCIA